MGQGRLFTTDNRSPTDIPAQGPSHFSHSDAIPLYVCLSSWRSQHIINRPIVRAASRQLKAVDCGHVFIVMGARVNKRLNENLYVAKCVRPQESAGKTK